jgi:hypothetical protein
MAATRSRAETDVLVASVRERTGTDVFAAKRLLDRADWDVKQAVEAHAAERTLLDQLRALLPEADDTLLSAYLGEHADDVQAACTACVLQLNAEAGVPGFPFGHLTSPLSRDAALVLRKLAASYEDDADARAAYSAAFDKLAASNASGAPEATALVCGACSLCLPATLEESLMKLTGVSRLTDDGRIPLRRVVRLLADPVKCVLQAHTRPDYDKDDCIRILAAYGWAIDVELPGITGVMRYYAKLDGSRDFARGYLTNYTQATSKATRALARLPYKMVGQTAQARALLKRLDLFAITNASRKPLVLVFCGLSGHGKTELAEEAARLCAGASQLGELSYTKIDCGEITHENDLWGVPTGMHGSEHQKPLDKHLQANAGRLSFVVLDELEKLPFALSGFLAVWDKGVYTSKWGKKQQYDCSKTVFICTTNLPFAGTDSKQLKASLADVKLTPEIKSRIDDVFCFSEFSDLEREVLVERFMRLACRNIEARDRDPLDVPRRRVLADQEVIDGFMKHIDALAVRSGGGRFIKNTADEAVGTSVREFEFENLALNGKPLKMCFNPDASEPRDALIASLLQEA